MFLLGLGAEWLHYDKGEYNKAIADYNKAIELNPKDADAYNNRAIAYYHKGNIEKACADARKACNLGMCKLYRLLQSKGYCR